MKDVERKVVAELMKNSRRSDRELAHAIKVSQPTISRTIAKLEKEKIIKEYTIIPDFQKLGYTLASITFAGLKTQLTPEEVQKARETTIRQICTECSNEVVLFERGIGISFGAVIIAIHKDYASYTKLKDKIKNYDFIDHQKTDSFLIDLQDQTHFRYLTFATLAKDILQNNENTQHLTQPAH